MGAGASANRANLVEKLPKTTDYDKLYQDLAAEDVSGRRYHRHDNALMLAVPGD